MTREGNALVFAHGIILYFGFKSLDEFQYYGISFRSWFVGFVRA